MKYKRKKMEKKKRKHMFKVALRTNGRIWQCFLMLKKLREGSSFLPKLRILTCSLPCFLQANFIAIDYRTGGGRMAHSLNDDK
jgi:hypothetical protein